MLLQTTQDRCSVVASKLCLPLGLVQHGCCFLVVLFVLMDQTNIPKILRTNNEAEDYIAEDDSSTSFFAERFPKRSPTQDHPPKGTCAFQTDWTMIGSRDRSVFHLARPTTQRNSQQPKTMQPSTTSQHAREGGNHPNERIFDEL